MEMCTNTDLLERIFFIGIHQHNLLQALKGWHHEGKKWLLCQHKHIFMLKCPDIDQL